MCGKQDADIGGIEDEGHRQRRIGTWSSRRTMWREVETWLLSCAYVVVRREEYRQIGRVVVSRRWEGRCSV
jgi:hypothetical protein